MSPGKPAGPHGTALRPPGPDRLRQDYPPSPPGGPPRRSPDLLLWPVLGAFLRWRHARTSLQLLLLAVAVLVILDGLFGPPLAPENLAGILPWVHWRGLVVLGLLVAGNLFCMACPFMLPRRAAKRILPAKAHWPQALRSKWPAIGLLFLFLWAYEAFDLWASPWLTAWLAIAYFAAAFLVDGFFRGAAFCKYLCPIGHFHFVNSAVSPVEVAIRDPAVCACCRTRDCIVGRYEKPRTLPVLNPSRTDASSPPPLPPGAGARGKLLQRGCELWLYQEKKSGNMDCTFCMECIHACPHDNVGILLRPPGRELWEDPLRAGVGRFSRRGDLAALALFLTFAAFMNAFGMVSPVYVLEASLAEALGTKPGPLTVGLLFLGGMVVLPFLAVALAGRASSRLAKSGRGWRGEATVYAYGLVPVGFGMWTAHYLFHFLIGGWTLVPALQQYLEDLGVPAFGTPSWALGAMIPEAWLLPVELLFLEGGWLLSLVVVYRIARREMGETAQAVRAAAPWWALASLLSAAGVWLLLQPMEMRGTLLAG